MAGITSVKNICVKRDSKCETCFHNRVGLAIATGLPPHQDLNLTFHGGKTLPSLTYKNFFVAGTNAWDPSDVQNINESLSAAMTDPGLNNVLAQYFAGNTVMTTVAPHELLSGSAPASVSQSDVEGAVRSLFLRGKMQGLPLASTVFNFLLPSGTVLTIDDGPNALTSPHGHAKSHHRPEIPIETEESSLEGLGGFHGSVHVRRRGISTTIY